MDNAFRRTSHQTTLPNPTNSTDRLYHVATELMRQMAQRPVRLVGVSAEKTGEDNFEQMDLFTDAARIDKQEKLDRAADALRRKFGGAALTRATLLSPDTRKPEALSAAKEREKTKNDPWRRWLPLMGHLYFCMSMASPEGEAVSGPDR